MCHRYKLALFSTLATVSKLHFQVKYQALKQINRILVCQLQQNMYILRNNNSHILLNLKRVGKKSLLGLLQHT